MENITQENKKNPLVAILLLITGLAVGGVIGFLLPNFLSEDTGEKETDTKEDTGATVYTTDSSLTKELVEEHNYIYNQYIHCTAAGTTFSYCFDGIITEDLITVDENSTNGTTNNSSIVEKIVSVSQEDNKLIVRVAVGQKIEEGYELSGYNASFVTKYIGQSAQSVINPNPGVIMEGDALPDPGVFELDKHYHLLDQFEFEFKYDEETDLYLFSQIEFI